MTEFPEPPTEPDPERDDTERPDDAEAPEDYGDDWRATRIGPWTWEEHLRGRGGPC